MLSGGGAPVTSRGHAFLLVGEDGDEASLLGVSWRPDTFVSGRTARIPAGHAIAADRSYSRRTVIFSG